MRTVLGVLSIVGFLTACTGGDGTNVVTDGPQDDDTDTPIPMDPDAPAPDEIPEVLARNLTSIAYSNNGTAGTNDDTLVVELSALDAPALLAAYDRNSALDVPGYIAFSAQDDPLDRMFVAVVAQSEDGSVQAGVVGDGGQFNRYYSGGYYQRENGATVPVTGLVSYAGTYAGITNLDDLDQDQIDPAPGGTPGALLPAQPRQTTGSIFLNVDFDDGAANGVVFDRQFADGEVLSNLFLTDGVLNDEGYFTGGVEMNDINGPLNTGEFGGAIGNNGDAVAGVVALTTIYVPNDPRDGQFDAEHGVFVLPRCGTPTSPPVCDNVNDFQ